jgi:carboxyl-terminal processing protease
MLAWVCVVVQAQPAKPDLALFDRTFDFVWTAVVEHYYDPDMKGLDWKDVGDRYRAQVPTMRTQAQFYGLLNRMLGELNDSHTRVVPKAAAQSQAQLSVTTGQRGVRLGEAAGEIFVREILPGSAAAAAGLRPGDVIEMVAAENAHGRYVNAFARVALPLLSRKREVALAAVLVVPRGKLLVLSVRDGAGTKLVSVPPDDLEPPAVVEVSEISDAIQSIRLRRFRADALTPMNQALAAPKVRGFVLDMRGNDGGDLGVAMLLADRLLPEPAITAHILSRTGSILGFFGSQREKIEIHGGKPGARREPVAVLVDERCASACEVLAAALRDNNRARVFGHHTAGSVAGISPKPLEMPDGGGLNISRIGILSPKRALLDNVGIAPDETCTITPAQLQRGQDCVLDAAVEWLGQQNGR